MIGKFSSYDCAVWIVFREGLEVRQPSPRLGGCAGCRRGRPWGTAASRLPALLRERDRRRVVVTVLPDCLSPHVAPVQTPFIRLAWRGPYNAEDRVRVIAWTCDCRTTVYELRHAGGQGYLRRTCRRGSEARIHESYRWSFREAEEMWARLLRGQVR